ncbi:MAG TPA: SAM-dependent methyltransferase, partial [Syntrophobacteria bacterium]|nr:SAM-dependent methyltransferase [Syntrophobacteria bacterium]
MMVITDLDKHRHRFLLTEHHDRWPGFKRDDVKGSLQEAGLKDANVTCAGETCCATSEGGSERSRVSIFVASGRK